MSLRAPAFLQKVKALDFLLLALVLVMAAWLRFENLGTMPNGFHGDEAIVGMEGQNILREGSIGPYSPLAMGQPTGPLYLTALSLHFFGSTVWAVRAVSALMGTLTVLVLYLMLRRHFQGSEGEKRVVALLGAASLATLNWHIHFSRIGFPISAWPLSTLLAVWAALEAVKRRQARWWFLTGLLTGLGIYVYNAQSLCILMMGLWLLFYLARQKDVLVARRMAWLASFGVAGLVVAVPMIRYALDPTHGYFQHPQQVSIFSSPDSPWLKFDGIGPKTGFLIGRFIGFWDNLSWHSRPDDVDGTGVVPVVPLLMLVVALVGLVLGWKARRGPLVGICLFALLLLPLGPMLTINGLDRRAFAMAPFVALLASIGFVEIYNCVVAAGAEQTFKDSRRKVKIPRQVLLIGLTFLAGFVTFQNLYGYFKQTLPSDPIQWTFATEMVAACRYFNTLPSNSCVLLYSERWGGEYETRRFLSPNVLVQDRSREHGDFSLGLDGVVGKPYFVLIGQYQKQVPQLQKLYPQYQIDKGPPLINGEPTFIAVYPSD